MPYDPTLATANLLLGGGIAASTSAGRQGAQIFTYGSTHKSTEVCGVTGFFSACGRQPLSSTPPHPNIQVRSGNCIGMGPGDLVVVIGSTGLGWGVISGSTFNGSTGTYASSAGYDCTITGITTA